MANPDKYKGTDKDPSSQRPWADQNASPAGTGKPTAEPIAGQMNMVTMYICVNDDVPRLNDALFEAALGSPDVEVKVRCPCRPSAAPASRWSPPHRAVWA